MTESRYNAMRRDHGIDQMKNPRDEVLETLITELPVNLRNLPIRQAVRVLALACASRNFTTNGPYVCVLDIGHAGLHSDGDEHTWERGTHFLEEDDLMSALVSRIKDLGLSAPTAEFAYTCGWMVGQLEKGNS